MGFVVFRLCLWMQWLCEVYALFREKNVSYQKQGLSGKCRISTPPLRIRRGIFGGMGIRRGIGSHLGEQLQIPKKLPECQGGNHLWIGSTFYLVSDGGLKGLATSQLGLLVGSRKEASHRQLLIVLSRW